MTMAQALKRTNERLDIYEEFLRNVVSDLSKIVAEDNGNKYAEGDLMGMKQALNLFTTLFEREVKTDD